RVPILRFEPGPLSHRSQNRLLGGLRWLCLVDLAYLGSVLRGVLIAFDCGFRWARVSASAGMDGGLGSACLLRCGADLSRICLLLGQAAVGLRLLHCRGQLPARGRGIRRQIDSPATQRRNVGCEGRGTIRACGLGLTGTAFAIPQELVALAGETRMRSS